MLEELEDLLFETVTIAAPASEDQSHAVTPATAVTYKAQVLPFVQRVTDRNGREAVSTARVIIPGRVAVDPRSVVTLPSGFTPQQPPIKEVRPTKGLDMDYTEIIL